MSLPIDKAIRKAQSHIKAGLLVEAEELYKQVLSKFPKNKKAIQGYQKLKGGIASEGSSTSEPQQEQIQELINLYNQGQFVKALDKAKPLIGLFPHAIHLHNIQGACHAALQRYDAAIDSYKQAIKIKPDYAEAYSNMGNALKDKGELDAAIDNYKQAIKIKPDYAEAYSNMGNVLKEKGELNAAIDSYNQAIKIKPDYAEAYSNMGVALKEKGELDAAIDSYKQAVKIKPDYAEAHRHLSTVKKYNFADEQITQMKFLYADQKLENDRKCHLCFALAKASEDLGDFQEAFDYLKEGNALRKKGLSYDIKKDQTIFANLKKSDLSISQNTVVSIKKPSDVTPIFILGMPRSGTTLVEQIVSSHSKVTGAGELRFVQQFGLKMAFGTQEINKRNLLNFREQYLNSLIQLGEGNLYITDKMPGNFQFIGLICRAFPETKIIHVKRDPAATCWSNFKHYFPASGLGYCYDLDDVVRYYQMYEDLMDFWNERYPDRIYRLDYDELTLDQEYETKRLISHLGLDWQGACLSPQKNKRAVKTASNQQVRQKVYKGSSQQWRKFEPYLDGAFDGLDG